MKNRSRGCVLSCATYIHKVLFFLLTPASTRFSALPAAPPDRALLCRLDDFLVLLEVNMSRSVGINDGQREVETRGADRAEAR